MIGTGRRKARVILHEVVLGLELGEVAVARELDGKAGLAQERLCEEGAVTENGHQIGQRRGEPLQFAEVLGRGGIRPALKEIQRPVGIGRLGEERGERRQQAGSKLLLQASEIRLCPGRIQK